MRQEPLTVALDRIAYTVSQGIRFSWFYSQYMAAGRRVDSVVPRDELPANLPDRDRLIGSLFDLFRRDYRNIEQGYYRMPHDMWPRPDRVLRMSRRFFRDLETVDERRKLQRTQEVYRRRSRRRGRRGYPRYYLQNFHYQSDGYLSDESAVLYDYQVEVLFHGGADAMRRQALVPLHEFLQ
ncbi:MAG: ubiquinone biosynthesis methyltransferase UbiE, partial [Alphaproteobacteria bacterium]